MSETTVDDLGLIYTIGHSNHPLEVFLGLLRDNAIDVLIDTRSSPYSRFSPQFNREALKAAICAEGMKYGFYGRELGGRPDDEDFYDEEGHVLYSAVAKSFLFNDGLERLTRGIQNHRIALLCSEEDPSVCHRRLLVSRVLFEQGIAAYHIRGSGEVQSEADIRQEEDRERNRQPALFDDEETPAWKSIQSVLPKARLRTSSDD